MDFIKINYTDAEYVLPTSIIDFKSDLNRNTGELSEKKTAQHFDFKLTRYPSGRTIIAGSIHKYHNRTDFNGDDFNFHELHRAIDDLANELNIKPGLCRLENLEIGVNIQTSFNPNIFLDNLLFHRSEEFNKPIAGKYYMQSEKNEYIIKTYNKTLQYKSDLTKLDRELKNVTLTARQRRDKEFLKKTIEEKLSPNTLRFEVKFTKMESLNQLGIYTLADLCNPNFFQIVKGLLLKEFAEVYFFDFTTDLGSMTKSQQIRFKDYRNPNYWKVLNKGSRYYHKEKFKDLTSKNSRNTKAQISQLISDKIDELAPKSLDILTDILSPCPEQKFRHFDHSNIGSISKNKASIIKKKVNVKIVDASTIKTSIIALEDVSMLDEGKPYQKREEKKCIYNNPRRLLQLERGFLNKK